MMTADDNAVVDSPAEGQLLRLLRHVSDGFVALDRDWRFTFVNPAAEELLRRPNAGLVGQSLWEAIPEAHASRFFEPLSRAMNDRVATQAEEFYQPRDRWYALRCFPTENGLAVLMQDITGRKRSEHRLQNLNEALEKRVAARTDELAREMVQRQEVETRLRTVLDNLPASVFLKDREGRYLYANPGMRALFPAGIEDYEGRTTEELFPPEIAESLLATDRQVLETGGKVSFEHQFGHAEGGRHSFSVKFPIRNPAGEITMICGVALDITEQKKAEAALRKTDRLASLGAMAAGIAHELNNPMSAAWNYLDAARRFTDGGRFEPAAECLDEVAACIRTGRGIVENMLRFARSEASCHAPMELHEAARRAVSLSRPLANRFGAVVEVAAEPDLPLVSGNEIQIEQALVNLIANAIEAGDQQRRVRVRIGFVVTDDSVWIVVRDDAGGMSAETAARASELFFTAGKPRGLGLGLAIVSAIMDHHGGSLDVKTELGRGAEVSLRLRR